MVDILFPKKSAFNFGFESSTASNDSILFLILLYIPPCVLKKCAFQLQKKLMHIR